MPASPPPPRSRYSDHPSRSSRDNDRDSREHREHHNSRDSHRSSSSRNERPSQRRRSRSPSPRHHRRRSRSRSRSPREREGKGGGDGGWNLARPPNSPGRPSLSLPPQSSLVPSSSSLPSHPSKEEKKPVNVEPDFKPSGLLAAETNTFQGVVLKYNEPPEARKPVRNWRLYVFKGKEQIDLFHVHRQSAYLVGRDRLVCDVPIEHPSTSKQHAVLQYRQINERNEFGDTKTLTKPFLIDLDSANGTVVNDEVIPPSRFYELKSGDVIKFAFSTREYVLLAET